MTDVLAERPGKIGGTTIRSSEAVARRQKARDNDSVYVSPRDMLVELVNDKKRFAARQRAAYGLCDENADVATASLLENFIDETDRRTWFLYETVVGGERTS